MAVTVGACDVCCVNLQFQLEEIAPNTSIMPNATKRRESLVDALMSQGNKGTFETLQTISGFGRPAGGVDCKLTIRYYQPSCDASATVPTSICDAGSDRGYTVECADVTVTGYREQKGTWNKHDMRCVCENNSDRIARELMQGARALRNDITQDVATLMYAQAGQYSNGNNSTVVPNSLPLLNGAGHINPAALSVVRAQHRLQFAVGNPFLIGGDILDMHVDVRAVAGTGTALGNDQLANPMSGLVPMVDYAAADAWRIAAGDADHHMMSWSPGAIQFLEWFQFEGEYEESGWDYTATTLLIDGWLFDFEVSYDKCDRTYTWKLSKYFDIFNLPESSYDPCLAGNHILHWEATCADFDCANYLLT